MADVSGSLLLHAGVVRPEQVNAALALRQREGGSFGECLVRIGAMTEEQLVEFYHRRLMIPRLDEARLAQISPKVLKRVPADMAAEFRVVPVDVDADGALTLAMADPSDNHAVDEVAFFADTFVLRSVARESVVRHAIEHHYRVLFARPGTRPTPAPAPRPTLQEIEEQIFLLEKVKRSDQTPLPIPLPPPDDSAPHDVGQGTPEQPILLTRPVVFGQRPKRDTLRGLGFAAPDPPIRPLQAAQARDEVAKLVLDYMEQLAGRTILLVVRKSLLIGHDARGLDGDELGQLAVNVAAPSLFRDAVVSRLPYLGPLPLDDMTRAFALVLGGVEGDVLLMPITVRDRVIAVVFADRMLRALPDAAVHATAREAGLAYERLILDGKR
jgi:hypothetical protein